MNESLKSPELSDLFENARDIIFTHDLDGNILWTNKAAQEILGYTQEEATRLNLSQIVPPEYLGMVRQTIARAIQGDTDTVMAVPVIAKNGSRRIIQVSGRVQFQDNKPVAVQGIGRDMTERALEEVRTLFAAVAECSDDAILTASPDGRIIGWSAGAERVFGYSADETRNQPLSVLAPADRHQEQADLFNKLLGGEAINRFETVRSNKSGSRINVLLTARPIRDTAGKLSSVACTIRDITLRKRAEQEVRRQKEFSEMLIQSSSDGIFAFDRMLTITLWNPAMQRITGFSRQEALGQRVPTLLRFLDETGEARCFAQALAGASPVSGGWRRQIPETLEQEFFEASYSPLTTEDQGIIGAFCSVRDVTKRALADRENQRKQEQLRGFAASIENAREGERKRIAREIHDELGQRLTALSLDLSCAETDLAKVSSELIAPVQARLHAMQELVATTIERVGKMCVELRPSVLDNLGLTAAIQWQAQEFETRTGIKCVFSRLAKGVALELQRSTAVFRIFQELLTNVARHAKAGMVRIKFENAGRNLVLQVRDNGKGIGEEEVNSPGSLGLLGIRERADWLGGEVHIQGTPGAGTTVTLTIPLERKQPAAKAVQAGK